MMPLTWVLESDVFPQTHAPLRDAILQAGHQLVDWREPWRRDVSHKRFEQGPVLFQGSLGNAHHIAHHMGWELGAFCDTERFRCTSWYASAQPWLMHDAYVHSTVEAFVADPHGVAGDVASDGRVFVRPDSPLKPFSGRVLELDAVSWASLDHGFYYDEQALPIVLAPVRVVGAEWRIVIANGQPITGSAYDPHTRSASTLSMSDDVFALASTIAKALPSPEAMYVLDLCECDGALKLLELNPFSGADLYACDMSAVVNAAERVAIEMSCRTSV